MKLGLKGFIEKLGKLPTLPPVALRLISAAEDEATSLKQIARLIESDQSLTSKLLKVANSAQFGRSRQVASVDRAIQLLGLDMVRSIVLSIVVVDLFKEEESRAFQMVEFWHHAGACAAASELLAEPLQYPRPQEAFVAGLLHDVGKLVFFQWDRDRYEEVVASAAGKSLLEAEEEALGMGHTLAGKMLLESWRFPDCLVQAAWLHHQPVEEFSCGSFHRLAFVVKCANSLCHLQRFGHSGNSAGDLGWTQLRQATGLSDEQLSDLSLEVLRRFETLSHSFDWKGATPVLYLSAMARANRKLGELQVELMSKNRSLVQQNSILESLAQLREILTVPTTPGGALEKIIELLAPTLPCGRVMGFVPLENEQLLEGRVKLTPSEAIRRISAPLQEADPPVSQWGALGRQVIRNVLRRVESSSELVDQILGALDSPSLVLLPLESRGDSFGLLLLEPDPQEPFNEALLKLLREYARLVSISLDHLRLIDKLNQQAEEIARMGRTAERIRSQLYQTERLASVGRLAAGAAHEINNPLTTISAHAQLLLRGVEEERSRKSLQTIVDQAARISKIISDLMGFARPAEPRIEPDRIEQVLQHALSTLENRLRVSNVEISVELPPDLPTIAADQKQLEQVFLNLMINAFQAMPEGGHLSIRGKSVSQGKRIRLEVSDTGRGIASQDLPFIFEPFFTTKQEGEGTGLGLAVCHSIIEGHRGTIEVTSQPGQGTTFIIHLPVGKPQGQEGKEEQGPQPLPRRSGESSHGSVLVVDDEEHVRNVVAESLALEGFQVDLAEDGVAALEKLRSYLYDAVVLDLRMPRKEGVQVLGWIREERPQLPVVVISGLAHEQDFQAAQQLGAFACLKKPFDINELVACVQKAVKESS